MQVAKIQGPVSSPGHTQVITQRINAQKCLHGMTRLRKDEAERTV